MYCPGYIILYQQLLVPTNCLIILDNIEMIIGELTLNIFINLLRSQNNQQYNKMKKYIYETVQIPPNINVGKQDKGNEAGAYLSNIINQKAQNSWEFVSVESIGVSTSPGCLASFFGKKSEYYLYYVIVFKREVD